MGEFVIKLPDVGEGVAEAELVEWFIEEGKNVSEDDVLASVMTDKATVEIPSPVEGKVKWIGADIGEIVAVGSPIIRIEIEGEGNATPGAEPAAAKEAPVKPAPAPEKKPEPIKAKANAAAAPVASASMAASAGRPPRKEGEAPLASPAVRNRANEGGVDLRRVHGSGPAGRISHEDLDAYFAGSGDGTSGGGSGLVANTSTKEIKVVGLRRKIAEKMTIAKSRIPHITYVDEVDVTALEETRAKLNTSRREGRPKLTMLPFLMRAMAKAISEQPQINATFDDEAGVVTMSGGVHIGIATQTPGGLVVPVVSHVEARSIWDCAGEMARLAVAARDGACTRAELSGSTITITSLGAMGGIVTTPVINHPEVAIVGVNKMQVKPVWDGAQFVPRKVMNLSSSFDHRVVDGWDAAVFIQRIKTLLETPAAIFIED